jgi:hypothetical protein
LPSPGSVGNDDGLAARIIIVTLQHCKHSTSAAAILNITDALLVGDIYRLT